MQRGRKWRARASDFRDGQFIACGGKLDTYAGTKREVAAAGAVPDDFDLNRHFIFIRQGRRPSLERRSIGLFQMGEFASGHLIADERGTVEVVRSAAGAASPSGAQLLQGFVAGFAATLVFHQSGLGLLHLFGLTLATPWNLDPVPPFEVPAVLSLAFWGGIWGTVLLLLHLQPHLARIRGSAYWVAAIIFGAVFPTFVGWFIVGPLKGLPIPNGFHLPGMLISPIVNGLWGLGVALFLRVLIRLRTEPA